MRLTDGGAFLFHQTGVAVVVAAYHSDLNFVVRFYYYYYY